MIHPRLPVSHRTGKHGSLGAAQHGRDSVFTPGHMAPVAPQHRRVLPPHLPAPCARVTSDVVQPPLQMQRQQLQGLVLVAFQHGHVRQMHLGAHPDVEPSVLHGHVKRRLQPCLSLLQCVSGGRRDIAGAGSVRSSLVVLGSRSRPQRLPKLECSSKQVHFAVQLLKVGPGVL